MHSEQEFLCAQLCVAELPSGDYTREIRFFDIGSSPSEAATTSQNTLPKVALRTIALPAQFSCVLGLFFEGARVCDASAVHR